MAAILSNMKSALTGNPSGAVASPTDLLAALQTNPDIQSAVGQYAPPALRQNLFLPEAGSPGFFGSHPQLATGLENTMIGMASMNQIPQTTGQSISMIANSLMAGPMAHRQYQMQQAMMPFQIAQMMGGVNKEQSEANMNNAHAAFFRSQAGYDDRGLGRGITDATQNRTNTNLTPRLASDGQMHSPDAVLPQGVSFLPQGNQPGPYGNSTLGRIIARIQGNDPAQVPGLMTDEEKGASQGQAMQALQQYNQSIAQTAGARNNAPGGPVARLQQEELFGGARQVHTETMSEYQKNLDNFNDPKKAYVLAGQAGVSNADQWISQQRTQLQQQMSQEQNRWLQVSNSHDMTPYLQPVIQGVASGKINLDNYSPDKINPMGVIAPSMNAPANTPAPTGDNPNGAPPPAGASLSPAAQSYLSNWK